MPAKRWRPLPLKKFPILQHLVYCWLTAGAKQLTCSEPDPLGTCSPNSLSWRYVWQSLSPR